MQISLRDNTLYTFERQTGLERPTALSSELHAAAMKLIAGNYSWGVPLRSIGLRAIDLVPDSVPDQLSLFEDQGRRERQERLERAVDDIRRRFGHYAIGRAVTTLDDTLRNINPKEDHVIHPVGYFKAV